MTKVHVSACGVDYKDEVRKFDGYIEELIYGAKAFKTIRRHIKS